MFSKILQAIKANPVVALDVVKYSLALLMLFGVPVPPGVDVALAALVVALGSLLTRALVTPNASVPTPSE